jgi:hypothetical protein
MNKNKEHVMRGAVPWLKRLVAGLSPRRPRSIHVGFVVDNHRPMSVRLL